MRFVESVGARAARFVGPFLGEDNLASLSHWILLSKFLRILDVDLIIDVGANVGRFARAMRYVGYKGLIVSFEPLPSEFEKMRRAMKNDHHWIGFNHAVGKEEKIQNLNVMQLSELSSFNNPTSLATRKYAEQNRVVMTEKVRVRRLDAVLGEISLHSRRTFLKTDTQGYEMQVILGMGDLLKMTRIIQCEISSIPLYEAMPQMEEILSFLRTNGFRPASFVPVTRVTDGSALEFDCLLVNEHAPSS